MLLTLLLACRCNPLDPPQEVTFTTHTVRQVGGRFRGELERPLTPQTAFAVERRCPKIESVHVRHANERIRHITLRGTQFEEVIRVAATLPEGKMANAQFGHVGDLLEFPIACTDCEIYLGVQAGDRTAACFGPGYSLTFKDGQIVQ